MIDATLPKQPITPKLGAVRAANSQKDNVVQKDDPKHRQRKTKGNKKQRVQCMHECCYVLHVSGAFP